MYQLIIITLALSQPFLCISSELSGFQPLTEKLIFPDNKLQQYARAELEKKYPDHSFLKNNPAPTQTRIEQKLDHAQELLNVCKKKDLLFQQLLEERIDLQEQIDLKTQRLRAIAQKKEEKKGNPPVKKQAFSDKKSVSPKSPGMQPQRKPKSTRTPAQQRYDAFKLLCHNYGTKPTKADLYSELTARCDKIYNNEKDNDSLSGPYFDHDKHVLSGAIDATWSFIYCPCEGDLKLLNCTFCNLSELKDFVNTHCTIKNCKQYKMDSYSSTPESISTQEDSSNKDDAASSGDEVLYGKHTASNKEETSYLKKYLLKKYNVSNKTSLIAKLKTLCADNPHGPELSYDQEDHIASGQLTADWIFQLYFDSGEILFCKMSRLPDDTIDWPKLNFSNKNGSSASSE